MRFKVQKCNGRLLGCCISISPEMMDVLGADILDDYIEMEKVHSSILIEFYPLEGWDHFVEVSYIPPNLRNIFDFILRIYATQHSNVNISMQRYRKIYVY